MTTITHEQFEAAIDAAGGCVADRCVLHAAFAAAGITIAPPEPPEAMVKLARGIVLVTGIEEGSIAWERGMKAALAALQYVDKVVVAHGLAAELTRLTDRDDEGRFVRKEPRNG